MTNHNQTAPDTQEITMHGLTKDYGGGRGIFDVDMTVRRAHRNKLEHYKIQKPSNIIPVRANEEQTELAVGAEDMATVIDIKRMAENAEKERKG